MSNRTKTIVFVIIATVFNLLLLGILLIASFKLVSLLFIERSGYMINLISFLMIGIPIIATFFVYSIAVRWAQRRWNIDQFLQPIFGRRR